jgi:hypothetical protein
MAVVVTVVVAVNTVGVEEFQQGRGHRARKPGLEAGKNVLSRQGLEIGKQNLEKEMVRV